jgi:flagellar basal-body rod protein FlgF
MAASAAPDKHFVSVTGTSLDMRPGPTALTGNPLDVLPDEGAFLAVQLPGGGTAYTRDGRLTLDVDRRLVSGAGRPVLDAGGGPIIVPPEVLPTIDDKGRVLGGDAELGQLALVHLSGPIDRMGGSLVVPGPGGRVVLAEGGVKSGELELGNASALEATIALVTAQRSYDSSMQAIQTYRQLDAKASELGRTR